VLDGFESVGVCEAYDPPSDESLPYAIAARPRARFATLAVWKAPIGRTHDWHELPAPARAYVERGERSLNHDDAEAAWRDLDQAEQAAAAIPARIRPGALPPDMVRLDAEIKQITHAIRMAAYNAETALARALDEHYARARDEAYALIREALTASGDIIPGPGQLLIRLDPLTAPRRTQALAALCDQLSQAQARYPGTDLVLRYEVKPHPIPA